MKPEKVLSGRIIFRIGNSLLEVFEHPDGRLSSTTTSESQVYDSANNPGAAQKRVAYAIAKEIFKKQKEEAENRKNFLANQPRLI